MKESMTPTTTLLHGDCLELMKDIEDGSIDAIICDLPYGTTNCAWDSVIPFEPLWEQYERIIKDKGAIVLTASQPFTSALVMSNPSIFKYEWIWEKSKASNFLQAKYMPLKAHENVLIFGRGKVNYYPQKTQGSPYNKGGVNKKHDNPEVSNSIPNYHTHVRKNKSGLRNPRTVQYFKTAESEGKYHPTLKPTWLMEYLIKTYTLEGETVLDNTMGSGTTGVACVNLNRNFIGMELDKGYFNIATNRIQEAKNNKTLF